MKRTCTSVLDYQIQLKSLPTMSQQLLLTILASFINQDDMSQSQSSEDESVTTQEYEMAQRLWDLDAAEQLIRLREQSPVAWNALKEVPMESVLPADAQDVWMHDYTDTQEILQRKSDLDLLGAFGEEENGFLPLPNLDAFVDKLCLIDEFERIVDKMYYSLFN